MGELIYLVERQKEDDLIIGVALRKFAEKYLHETTIAVPIDYKKVHNNDKLLLIAADDYESKDEKRHVHLPISDFSLEILEENSKADESEYADAITRLFQPQNASTLQRLKEEIDKAVKEYR